MVYDFPAPRAAAATLAPEGYDLVRFLTAHAGDRNNPHHVALSQLAGADALATREWVESKGYLTEHQSLDGYATESWVLGKNYLTEHQSLDGYATESWVESKGYLVEHQDLAPLEARVSALEANYADALATADEILGTA